MCGGGGILGLGAPKAKEVDPPDPIIPAQPAPTPRTDSGAVVALGDTPDEIAGQTRKRAGASRSKGTSTIRAGYSQDLGL